MNTHPSDTAGTVPLTLTETVQARGETVTRERQTVQDTSKLARVYYLRGDTIYQKLDSFKHWVAANRVFSQLELLSYLEEIMAAPATLETVEAQQVD